MYVRYTVKRKDNLRANSYVHCSQRFWALLHFNVNLQNTFKFELTTEKNSRMLSRCIIGTTGLPAVTLHLAYVFHSATILVRILMNTCNVFKTD